MDTMLALLRVGLPGCTPGFMLRWLAARLVKASESTSVKVVTEVEWVDRWNDGYGAGSGNVRTY